MAVTIKQIADYAGVSRGTVDRALNNRDGINPEVSARIRQIADELGYTPNRAGKALASKKKPIQIGVLLNSLGNPFYDEVLEGIFAARQEYQDFSVQVHVKQLKGYEVEEQLAEIDRLLEQNVSAIAVTSINDPRLTQRINELCAAGIAVVELNSAAESTPETYYIGCDYEKSGATAAGLMGLCTGGHARVGIVTGSVKMLGHNQRIHGFTQACRQDFPGLEVAEIVENNDDDAQSYRVTKQMLSHAALDAIYFTAAGVSGGIRAVDEISTGTRPVIICCDAPAQVRELLLRGKISAAVCQQPFKQGYECIRTIFNRIMSGEFPTEKRLYMENEIKIKYNL